MTQRQELFERLRQRAKELMADEKKRLNLLLLTGLAGMLLLAGSEWFAPTAKKTEASPPTRPAAEQDYAAALEIRLQSLLSKVDGAGETEVMVTLAQGETSIYAEDAERGADGSEKTQHVLLSGGDALVERVETPALLGVAVLCAGGDNAAVQSRITAIVQALTDLGSNHITVAKRKGA